MKICFISFEYPPFLIGGAGVYAARITAALAKLGHEVHVISPIIGKQEGYHVENGVTVHRIPIVRRNLLSAPSFWLKLITRYNAIRGSADGFDLVHGNVVSDFSLSKWQVKEPRVITVHHLAYLAAQHVPVFKRIFRLSGEAGLIPIVEKATIARADRIIAVSNFTKNTLIHTYGIPPSKISVVYNGIDADRHRLSWKDNEKFRKTFGLEEDDFIYLFVGRLDDPRKNVPFLLEGFQILLSVHRKSSKLVLVGAGGQLLLRKKLKRGGIEHDVIILGHVDEGTLRDCYNACDAFVTPSLLEGFGLTILEAMAAGKPVVCLKGGAISELVRNGENGILVDRQDPRALASAMAFLIEHPDTTSNMGRSNRQYVLREFSWSKSAKLTQDVYKSVLNST